MMIHAFNPSTGVGIPLAPGTFWLTSPHPADESRFCEKPVSENKVGHNKGQQWHRPLASKCTCTEVHSCAHTHTYEN